ncbi:MAG: serine protease [Candidatus Woesearchaeota archaeon]
MNKKALSALAATALALGLGTQSGCAYMTKAAFDSEVAAAVEKKIDSREAQINQSLESIMSSIYCIKNEAQYQRAGATEEPYSTLLEGGGTGFAFAYHDGHTYLVTSAHVVKNDTMRISTVPVGEEGDFDVHIYSLISEKSAIVDDRFDSDASDDISLELVAVDEDNDVALLRTAKKLPVSSAYMIDQDIIPSVGEDVFITGVPRGIVSVPSKGTFAKPQHTFSDGDSLDIMDIDATAGNSGSPYFVRKGNTLYWAGLTGQLLPEENGSELFALGNPLKSFYHLINDYIPMDKEER